MSMFFEAYTAPAQSVTGSIAGTSGTPAALLQVAGEVLLLAHAQSPSASFTQGAQLLAAMTSLPRALLSGASGLRGTLGTPTALLQVGNYFNAVAMAPTAFFWSGALLRGTTDAPAMPMSAAPSSNAALLFASGPTATLDTQSTYGLSATADMLTGAPAALLAAAGTSSLRGRALAPHAMLQQQVVVQNYVGLMVGAALQMTGGNTVTWVLTDALNAADSYLARSTYVLSDNMQATDALQLVLRALATLQDGFTASDFVGAVLRSLIADRASLSSSPSAWLKIAAALSSALGASDAIGWKVNSHVVVALSLALRDAVFDAQWQHLTDSAHAADAVLATAQHIAELLDSFTAQAQLTSRALLYALLADNVALDDTLDVKAQVLQALADGALMGFTLYTGEDVYTAWVMTPSTRAMRRYLNYPFNSYAQIGDQLFGADAAGVYLLSGPDNDAGAEIYAALRTGLLDFGTRQMKRMERAYLGYASDGTLNLRVCVTSPTGSKVDYTYAMTAVPAAAPREQRIGIGKGLKSVYWQFELNNDATGSAFELSDLTVLPMILTRRV